MSGFEWNKIAAAILLAGLIAMVVGTVTEALYEPELKPEKRGYQVAVTEEAPGKAGAEAEKEAPVDIPALLASANLEAGKASAAKCAACHDFAKGGANKVGPALWSVVGRAKASHEGYSYSDALKAKGGNWSFEDLFAFVHNPKTFVPGTKMGFAGISKPQEVANVVVYLRSLSDSPAALPAKK
jgi:cytochrome c